MGAGSTGDTDAAALIASAFMPQTRTPAAQGAGQVTTPGYSTPISLFAPMAQPSKPPVPIYQGAIPGTTPTKKAVVDDTFDWITASGRNT